MAGVITDDHEWIVFGQESGGKIYVFKFNGATYDSNQNITAGHGVGSIAITNDHEFLVIGGNSY